VWAKIYRIEVFPIETDKNMPYTKIAGNSNPVIVKEIQGGATSWTASSEEDLSNGGQYIWYVQAIDEYGTGTWSKGKVFKVDVALPFSAIGDRLGEKLKEHGVSEEVINGVLDDMQAEAQSGTLLGIDPLAADAQTKNTMGVQALQDANNTFYGLNAGAANTTGENNIFIGHSAGDSNTTGDSNIFIGRNSGYQNSMGNSDIFIGYYSGFSNTWGMGNTYLGHKAGESGTGAQGNAFLGNLAGNKNTADWNTFIGNNAGSSNTYGTYNVMLGYQAGTLTTTGSYNTFLGYQAGTMNVTGAGNLFLGYQSGLNETGSNKLYIENSNSSSPLVWGDFSSDIFAINGKIGVNTHAPAFPMEMKQTGANASIVVDRTDGATNYINATATSGNFGTVTNHVLRLVVNSLWRMRLHIDNSLTMKNGASCTAGGVWTNASSRDLKENINDLTTEQAFDALDSLQPVTYNYRADKEDEHVGFIAEDVPELVATKDRKGMSPMDVVAVLTKVLQEQQKISREQQKTIEGLKQEIAELKAKDTEK
jgi:hypothetical protein